jgi:hypothetical protein
VGHRHVRAETNDKFNDTFYAFKQFYAANSSKKRIVKIKMHSAITKMTSAG